MNTHSPNGKVIPEDSKVNPLLKSEDDESVPPSGSSCSSSHITRPSNTYEGSSFLSKMFFIWPEKLLKEGVVKTIEEKDLPNVMQQEESRHNREAFEKIWRDEVDRVEALKKKYPEGSTKRASLRPSLQRAMLIDFLKRTWIVQPCMMASSTARIAMSLALGFLIQSFIDRSKEGYIWAAVVVLCNAVVLFEHHHVFFITWRQGMQYRIGAVASVFSKSLRLSSVAGRNSISVGPTMNLISNDVERFMLATLFASYIIWAPLQAIAILVIGLFMIGPAFAAGVGILLFVFIPTQMILGKRFASLRSKVAAITDERMNLVSQAIEGARVMKMSGWENELQKRILNARAREVKQIQKANRSKALNEGMFYVTYGVVSTTIFVFHVYIFDGILITRDVFTVLGLVNVLQLELTKHLSLGVNACSECWISLKRIQKFLETPELKKADSASAHDCTESPQANADEVITLNDVTCYWDEGKGGVDDVEIDDSRAVALRKINLSLKKNELTFIVGAVGCGKSALLYALAGELLPDHGQITRSYSTLAYAAQNPWIMNGTVRTNILMGVPYDPVFYQEVVEACGLLQDFTQFIDGDQTIVGDRGVQCSGGQKARIGLARALYLDADVVLLDDPLSAVDSKVGRHIFYSAVQDLAVKKGKCVVLVTHQHQYIGNGRCVHISNGVLKSLGSFDECVKNSEGELHFVSHNAEELEDAVNVEDKNKPSKASQLNQGTVQAEAIRESSEPEEHQETKITGVVSKATFLHYAESMGGVWLVVGLLITFSIAQAMHLSNTVVVGRWSELDADDQKSGVVLAIVLGLVGALITFAFLQSLTSFTLTVRASKRLHDAMVTAVLRAKIEFFDTNPSGRILNRFSGDVGSNDDLLPATLFDFTMCTFYVTGALTAAFIALPFILVLMPPLIWYFARVRRTFVKTSRELKRFEGLARSPIFSMLSESISGISTIRSNGVETYISKKFEEYHDTHSRAFWSFLASSRWLGFRMDFLMFLNCSLASFLAVMFNEQGWFEVDPVVFGLALSLLIQLGSIFQWTIRQSAEVVNQMVCVERVTEYSKLEPEAALTCDRDSDDTIASWPANGSIEVHDLSVRYRASLPLSLDKVSFNVPIGKRLGIVGRTGSGKSTLVQALFRILEAENGQILIDGVDISQLGLHKLRKGMSVINQYPVLFSGCTVRENLDPFGAFSEEQVIDALTDVQMIQAVSALPYGIDSQVADGGTNFSVGERQLLCLARAMLQKSKILVLDEPTANVDGRTDKLLQEAVNKSFHGATIISVAHRLDTIIENDLILVLGGGKVLEYGSPSELISLNGHFSSMVNDTGAEMSSALKRRAMRNHK